MQSAHTEVVACSGYPADTYDRYVLGLLNPDERFQLDRRIEQKCPDCISGVQRSMNLWLVFANSLEQTEPAADFRARLVRIAELSNRVLTVPKRHRRVREPAILISSLVVICLILVTLLIFTYIAGRQSARMDSERTTNQFAAFDALRDSAGRDHRAAEGFNPRLGRKAILNRVLLHRATEKAVRLSLKKPKPKFSNCKPSASVTFSRRK